VSLQARRGVSIEARHIFYVPDQVEAKQDATEGKTAKTSAWPAALGVETENQGEATTGGWSVGS